MTCGQDVLLVGVRQPVVARASTEGGCLRQFGERGVPGVDGIAGLVYGADVRLVAVQPAALGVGVGEGFPAQFDQVQGAVALGAGVFLGGQAGTQGVVLPQCQAQVEEPGGLGGGGAVVMGAKCGPGEGAVVVVQIVDAVEPFDGYGRGHGLLLGTVADVDAPGLEVVVDGLAIADAGGLGQFHHVGCAGVPGRGDQGCSPTGGGPVTQGGQGSFSCCTHSTIMLSIQWTCLLNGQHLAGFRGWLSVAECQ
ncbi:hypothetical protein [Streptomyces sp. Ac-502]|uniref:hypothetical protein n=1 Tax=Streptomyces sp. Ac-502 TaxID=3342801 RepID=UPI0038629660